MVSYSNYSYEPSLGRRVSSGKSEIDDYPVAETVVSKLQQMATDIKWTQQHLKGRKVKARVINDSFFNVGQHLEPGTVDLIVTSPPYLNNYHYNRNTRPQLYWLGYVGKPGDLRHLEEANFGKFWQTVRDRSQIPLDFDSPDSELTEQLDLLRTLMIAGSSPRG
jgi:hypothetical protein